VLRGGEIFLLNGELGAGKTVFAKGLAAGLNIPPDDVNSPTFTLVNIHQGRLKFYHIDLYRVENDMYSGLGLDEVFEDSDNVIAIEWSERLVREPAPAFHVELKYVSDSERLLIITAQ
jgi:tRNA threonylcarbamoyladenosine biosynthesis protein TsaE